MSLDLLILNLNNLSSELSQSGKKDIAMFFSEHCNTLRNSRMDSRDVKYALKELITCRAIAQYGNFSINEEKILDDIINEVNKLCVP